MYQNLCRTIWASVGNNIDKRDNRFVYRRQGYHVKASIHFNTFFKDLIKIRTIFLDAACLDSSEPPDLLG